MSTKRTARLVIVCVALAVAGSAAQTPSSPKPRLGELILLAGAGDHAADEALRGALSDAGANLRAAAARAIAVVPHPELFKDLIGALAREREASVAAEIARDILYLGGAPALEIVQAQMPRFGRQLAPVVAEWLARMQPERLVEKIPELAAQTGEDRGGLAAIVWMAAAMHPDRRDALFNIWMSAAPDGQWRALLERAYAPPRTIEQDATAIFKAALASARPSARRESVWFVLQTLAERRDVPKAILEAALPLDVAGQTEWERFGRELVARRLRKGSPRDRSELLKTEAARHRDIALMRQFPQLTDSERETLTTIFGDTSSFHPLSWAGAASTRLMPSVVPGALAETLSAAGCDIQPQPRFAGGTMTFNQDGRPRSISFDPKSAPEPCLKAFTALALLAVADQDHPITAAPQLLMLPIVRAYVECSSTPVDSDERHDVSGVITAPRKTRDVKPVYPDEAMARRIQGVVIVESRITTTGCISHGRVIRSVPMLDWPALAAVSQWGFEPARIDGRPVPTHFNASVNFELR